MMSALGSSVLKLSAVSSSSRRKYWY